MPIIEAYLLYSHSVPNLRSRFYRLHNPQRICTPGGYLYTVDIE